ncbi:MAG: OmpA family protein [Saprospiraceae bacterium]|nr:OmpA family protein [Saprospiraceae bacterium]
MAASLTEASTKLADCEEEKSELESQLNTQKNDIKTKDTQIGLLEDQIATLKSTNTNLLDRMTDLSIVSKAGAESIQKSLETINERNQYIKNLTSDIQRKDSLNLALVTNLKRSLANVNDEDIQIEVKKGVVYVSLSDKMLFKSGSDQINSRAEEVLGKVAKVINDHKGIEILVEGHTDSVPIKNDRIRDNWDLSVLRATAVVRNLQTKHGVDPARMTAGGRSEYLPKATNDSKDGRSLNRRTEIIIIPKLDQFFELMVPEEK